MSLQSQVSGRLAQLRVAGQLLVSPRPWPGRSAGGPRPRGSAYGPLVALGQHGYCAWPSAGVGAWGAAGRGAWVRTWAPLAMAAKVDLSTSTDWKEAKSFLKGLSDKQREEHYFCKDFIKLKKIPMWKETAKGLAGKVENPKYKKDKQLNEKISLFRGDITKLEVDAIVNAGPSPSFLWIWIPELEPTPGWLGPKPSPGNWVSGMLSDMLMAGQECCRGSWGRGGLLQLGVCSPTGLHGGNQAAGSNPSHGRPTLTTLGKSLNLFEPPSMHKWQK
ncbi:ADP-ribose glycohydrolase MACROD1 isoform X2 [Rattus norvegicus]|uniref:ADP-ribose glycohydrolase MACROD1 isoform X2 n=2 Tax=Rattus norvegicus TaxID=10116 RepID=UPI002FD7C880